MVLKFKKEEISEQTQVCVLGVKGWSPALHQGLQAAHTGRNHWWERAAPHPTPQDMEASVSGSAGLSSQSKRAGHSQRSPRSCGGSFDPEWDLTLRRGNSYFRSPLDFLGGHNTEFNSLTCGQSPGFLTSVGFWEVSPDSNAPPCP